MAAKYIDISRWDTQMAYAKRVAQCHNAVGIAKHLAYMLLAFMLLAFMRLASWREALTPPTPLRAALNCGMYLYKFFINFQNYPMLRGSV